ncbi:polysaccharide deacetylase family protein [Mycobacterium sp. 21AC1]|uniref:polysaccharide deacetylase family protein n=1 Tax=[Mycobacterium] appelbergii TaxID=2939269 RepID=UPI0029390531|nr:polysaccharide deacetylase family protein [Mycobacterium sp. 21AC1]MDV3129898.1 polysaccharide deacetylase family protein [Mycobacterium sp. 21AC1]
MPWKTGYTISDERTIADADVHWPGDTRMCLTVVVDFGPDCGPDGITAADLSTPDHHYAMHGGLNALRRIFDAYGIRATFATSGVIAEIYPETLQSLSADGHEIAGNGYLREDASTLSTATELSRIRRTVLAVESATSVRPRGWYALPRAGDKFAVGAVSDHTVNHILDQGFTYFGNSSADDLPHYWITDPDLKRGILAMPYHYAFDDQFFLLFPSCGTGLENADTLARNWTGELRAQYRRGRSTTIVVHPNSIAWPHRLYVLEEFLASATRLPGVWNATAGACADYWTRHHRLDDIVIKSSIWTHYDDSLN